MKTPIRITFFVALICSTLTSCTNQSSTQDVQTSDETSVEDLPVIEAEITNPPFVPPPIERKSAAKVIVKLEVQEVVKRLSDGVEYTFWTFGGVVPGKFIRIREGDQVEFHLMNHPDNKNPHNIDLHAVTGQGGGAASTFTAPGHETVFSFAALNPGLYVYHCATAPVGMHIGNGMYGLILVEPKEGLPPVDKEYYVMQGVFIDWIGHCACYIDTVPLCGYDLNHKPGMFIRESLKARMQSTLWRGRYRNRINVSNVIWIIKWYRMPT